jgi:hypothetical protein
VVLGPFKAEGLWGFLIPDNIRKDLVKALVVKDTRVLADLAEDLEGLEAAFSIAHTFDGKVFKVFELVLHHVMYN